MDGPESSSEGALRGLGKPALVCALLSGMVFAVVFGAVWLLESRVPMVRMSEREPAAVRPPAPDGEGSSLRFAVATMVSAESTDFIYDRLVTRICKKVGLRKEFKLHTSYAKSRRALERGELDVAFVCTGTYTRSRQRGLIKLLVQPEFEDGLKYQSVFLVPAKSKAETLADLRGLVMAFTDEESNTGCFVPTVALLDRDWHPKSFFKEIRFTGSHDLSIEAVARGRVDVAAVDSLIWESAKREDSELAGLVRVLWRSEAFGPPPIVVPTNIDHKLEASIRRAFLALNTDEDGREILSAIGIKRFVMPSPEDYESAIKLYERFAAQERTE